MGGTVLENLSSKKLLALSGILLSLLVAAFMLGGLVAPAPSTPWLMIGTTCLEPSTAVDGGTAAEPQWIYPRPLSWTLKDKINETEQEELMKKRTPGQPTCTHVRLDDKELINKQMITASQIVFAFQMPGPRENEELQMSRWFQHMTGLLHFEMQFNDKPRQDPVPKLLLDIRMAYRESMDDLSWHTIGNSSEERLFKCHSAKPHLVDDTHDDDHDINIEHEHYECPVVPVFELPAYYPYYLLNLRLPVSDNNDFNVDIGEVIDVSLVTIFQNGGFTQVWLGLKSVVFVSLIPVLVWYRRRISMLMRKPTLLEKGLFWLGISLCILNLPIEWFSLTSHIPAMPLISDLRQGLFMTSLLCFWIIFIGEHTMDGLHRDRVLAYWKQLALVMVTCLFLLAFDMCERGVQLVNPFYSIWSTEASSRLAMAFIYMSAIAATLYLLYLLYMIIQVLRHISIRKRTLPSMAPRASKFYHSILVRIKFMMLITAVAIILTITFFILTMISESSWKYDDEYDDIRYPALQINSAFFTGVYSMWNLYVMLLMSMYAPSHKQKLTSGTSYTDDSGEDIEFTQLTSATGTAVTPIPGGSGTAGGGGAMCEGTSDETTALTQPQQPASTSATITAFVSKAAQD